MRALLLQLDGKIPNLALMRLAFHFRSAGYEVVLRRAANERSLEPHLGDGPWDFVCASAIFRRTIPLAERAMLTYPGIVLGGTGVDPARPGELVPLSPAIQKKPTALETLGVGEAADYSDYPVFRQSIGFTQRGCRLRCPFCCVPQKEGKARAVGTIWEIWRGNPWPRELLLLDNDFFGVPEWRRRVEEIHEGGFKVSFNQGINARFLTDEAAAAISGIDYRDDSMTVKRIYTAWDSRSDERKLFDGLEALVRHGVKPDHIMVYMLIGYWPNEDHEARDYRRARLREFGARPSPMPFTRTKELVGFQRWVIGAYDKRIPWSDWKAAGYEPRRLPGETAAKRLSQEVLAFA